MLSAGLPCLRTARIHLVVPDLCVVHGQDVLCRLWCTARPGQILQDQPGFFVSISQQDSLPRRKCRSAWCFLFFLNLGVEDSSRERATSAITYRVLHVARNFWSMKRRYSPRRGSGCTLGLHSQAEQPIIFDGLISQPSGMVLRAVWRLRAGSHRFRQTLAPTGSPLSLVPLSDRHSFSPGCRVAAELRDSSHFDRLPALMRK